MVPVVAPLSKNQIEIMAAAVLSEVQPEVLKGNCPVDVEFIYDVYIPEKLGIKTGYTDLTEIGSNVLGYTDASIKESYVDKSLYESGKQSEIRRCRSAIAHEAFHCMEHVPVLNYFRSISRNGDDVLYRVARNEIPAYLDPEWQSWMYAGALLMPAVSVKRYWEKGAGVKRLAEIFDVNPAFARVRLSKLGLKTD
jgi:hypothetical protein